MPSKILSKKLDLLRALEAKEKSRVETAREFEDQNIVDEEFVGPTAGRVGLVSPDSRQAVRKRVAEMDTFDQFFTEVSPSIGGGMVGGAIGAIPPLAAATGGVSIPLGAAVGGILGEVFGQETGISPESDAAIILSGAGGLGPGIAAGTRAAMKRFARAVENVPSVAAAKTRMTKEAAAGEFESVGTQIVAKRTGLIKEDAYSLYAASKHFAGADIPIEKFQRTFSEVEKVIENMRELPGMEAAAAKAEKGLKNVMDVETKSLGVQDVMKVYKTLNELANTAAMTPRAAKVSEDLFKMFDDDIDMIVKGSENMASQKAMAFTQGAFKRSELDRAIQTFERGVAQFTKQADNGEDILVDVKELRTWLFNKTNPKHADYDKRLATELAQDLPDLKSQLGLWTKIAAKGENSGGPGSLVLRNLTAKTGAGVAGYLVAGPVGAGIGAIAGSRLPEGITGILLTPKGRRMLTAMANAGNGAINQQRWATLASIAANASRPVVLPTESFFGGNEEEQQ